MATQYILVTPNSLQWTSNTLDKYMTRIHPRTSVGIAKVHAQYVSKTLARLELTMLSDMLAGHSAAQ